MIRASATARLPRAAATVAVALSALIAFAASAPAIAATPASKVIVQLVPGSSAAVHRTVGRAVGDAGGRVVHVLRIVNGFGAPLRVRWTAAVMATPAVLAVTPDGTMRPQASPPTATGPASV